MTSIPQTAGARDESQGGFTLLELMIAVAIVGILAAVAVPAFMRYIRKARTTEAIEHTEKIYNGARIYYFEPHGEAIQPRFPASQAATPAVSCCANGGKCAPDAADWQTPTWNALEFSMNDPFYYQYQFISSGVGNDSVFTAMALGNLDCDDDISTFSMVGKVDPKDGAFGLARIDRKNPLE